MTKKQSIIPYEVITPAVGGDPVAMTYILDHFDGYLNRLASKTLFDGTGNTYTYVDQDVKRRLGVKLMVSVLKFEINVT